jgi:CBS-domain-containing membrane protein
MERDVDGSYRTPRIEHARVDDAMRQGIFTCSASASLREAARTTSLHHVHTVVVTDPADGSPTGIVADSSLVRAMLDAAHPSKLAAARPLRRADSSQRLPMPRVWHTLAELDQRAVVLGESGRSDEQSTTDVGRTRQNLGRENLGVGPREALPPRTVRTSVSKRAAVPRQRSIDAASE